MGSRFETDPPPFWRQRGWLVPAVSFAVLLCGGGGFLVLRDEPVTDAAPRPAGTVLVDGRPDGCRTDDSIQDAPAGPPADVTWRELNGARVPLSASAGPIRTDGPVLWCFAHTPAGAVMAAHVIPRQLSGGDWRAVVERQVAPGPGREIFVAMRSSLDDAPAAHTAVTVAGFALSVYTAERATVRVLVRLAGFGDAAADYRLAWSDGDWQVVPSSAGELYTPPAPVTTTAGFILWGA
ncbi:hypothetical protein J2S43_001940 [Catenuloplanes nepalensis]|uniref:DUF8175 domain-containing protein n=1 Tax=Catenuloplanes nepalensis TaxID=587533 RepID=A0ABT9MQ71_9ACTN|nr:hypothetical protein [Catenuloplanes nepalensis]MDP9793428.1 hypothetical protein [Catenuloplanes nepalensis]